MTTLDDLWRAVQDHPGEDTPRLMLADELEDSDPPRAELIRVQVELSQLPKGVDHG